MAVSATFLLVAAGAAATLLRAAVAVNPVRGFRALGRVTAPSRGAARGFPSSDKEEPVNNHDAWMRDHYGSPADYLEQLLPLLEASRVAILAADYSGGNDEGGVHQITLYATVERDENGEPQLGRLLHDQTNLIPYSGGWEDPVWERCNQILSTKYGSWAGDYSAWGVLYIDVEKRRCWMDGSETVEQPVDIDDAIDITL